MSELLNQIRDMVETRAKKLQKDIAESRQLVTRYEAELVPLMAILKVLSPKPSPPTGTAEALSAAVAAAPVGNGSPRPTLYNKTTELKEQRHPHTGDVLASGSSEAMLKTVAAKVATQAIAAQPVVGKVPQRWSQYKLPPRARLFLAKFGNVKGQIHRQQVMDWYRTVSPTIDSLSLRQAASDIAGILINKGILHRDAPGVYSYTKK